MWRENKKKPIAMYLVWTFAIAWVCEGLLILGERIGLLTGTAGFIATYVVIGFGAGFAPAYATYIILRRHQKITGFKSFLALVGKGEHIGRALLVSTVFFASQLVVNLITKSHNGNPWYLFIAYLPLMIVGGGIEEIGWRGFLQPALEEKLPFALSAAVVGIIWAVWHLPLWLVQTSGQAGSNFVSFLCFCVVFSFVLGALYRLTKNVFLCILLHAWGNVLGGMFVGDADFNPPGLLLLAVYLVEIALCVGAVYVKNRHELTRRSAVSRSRQLR